MTVDSAEPSDPGACERLLDEVPDSVGDQDRRSITPDDAPGAAWGDPAIVLTCGGAMPESFDRFSECFEVQGVDWYAPEELNEDQSADAELTTVGIRPVVAVTVPAAYRPEGISAVTTDLAPAIKQTLESVKPCQ